MIMFCAKIILIRPLTRSSREWNLRESSSNFLWRLTVVTDALLVDWIPRAHLYWCLDSYAYGVSGKNDSFGRHESSPAREPFMEIRTPRFVGRTSRRPIYRALVPDVLHQ